MELVFENQGREFVSRLVLLRDSRYECKSLRVHYLHSLENLQYERYTAPVRKQQFLWGRIACKMALELYWANITNEIQITNGVFGQPLVLHPLLANIHVSISHKKNIATAVGFREEHPMAVDVELYNASHSQTVISQCTDKELRMTETLPEEYRHNFLWSVKESVSKALKTGLNTPFRLFEITRFQPSSLPVFTYESEMSNFGQYRILSLVEEGYVLSLAVPARSIIKSVEVK